MKIRTGFVSNSSSSSFIIAVKKEDPRDLVITISIDEIGEGESLEDFEKSSDSFCAVEPDDNKYVNALRKKCKKYEATHNFVELTLDQYEDAILIQALAQKQKDVIVIEGGEY